MTDVQKDRSRLLNKQKSERNELEKKLKKAKGLMKDKLEKDIEELEAKHEKELAEFGGDGDEKEEAGGDDDAKNDAKKKGKKGKKADKKPDKKKAKSSDEEEEENIEDREIFRERQWNGLSKKELEECCAERGLSKKGGKDDMTYRLICFHHEQAKLVEANPHLVDLQKEREKKREEDERAEEEAADESSESEDEEDSEDDDDGDDGALNVSAEVAEKQFKREKMVRGAIKHQLVNVGPFALEEIPLVLGNKGVKGFTPQIVGYSSLRKFIKAQPKKYMRFEKKTGMVIPPKDKYL